MARNIRNNQLETRTNRLKIPITKKPIFLKISAGVSLGYRRNQTDGAWVLRRSNGKGGMVAQGIGLADDYHEADGQSFLTFFDAQERAKDIASGNDQVAKPLTVAAAVENYLAILTGRNQHTAYDCRLRLQKHFLPSFGDKLISSLTKTQLENWQAGLVAKSHDPEVVRKSKDSANRLLGMVRATLNHCARDQTHNLDDSAWRLIRPFKAVGQPRSIRYTSEEVAKIIAAAPDQSTRNLIEAISLTGCRYGEAISAKVSSVNVETGNWHVTGKTGSRSVILQRSAIAFFKGLVNGRSGDEFLFTRQAGQPWKASDQNRPFKIALKRAGLSTDGSLYALRHSYLSRGIEAGIPLNVLADNAGTSVRMISQTYAHVLDEKQRAFIDLLDDGK